MACPYEFYKEEETYFPRLYCKETGKFCIYSKKCTKVNKFVQLDGSKWKECFMYIEAQKKYIPSGSYFIQSSRTNRDGKLYLYVVIKDRVERILTDFTEIDQNYIYLRKKIDGYEVSLVPFKRKTKKNEQEKRN